MNALDLRELNGRVVLVASAQDSRNPPTGRRGTLRIEEDGPDAPRVVVEVEFPEMFTSRAHVRRVVLRDEELVPMLESEQDGAMTLRIQGRLDPELHPGNE